jgi:thioredoxin 1
MIWIVLMGLAAGGLIGGVVGYAGKGRPGGRGFAGKPLVGTVFGALFGAGIAYSAFHRAVSGGTTLPNVPTISTSEEFDAKVLKSPTPVLVDFFATWCEPCHMLEPTIADLETAYHGRVAFFRVDVDKAPDLARAYDVQGMPSVFVFSDGNQASPALLGLRDEGDYRQALDKALEK